jgi:RND family efflux transporter MFP subunit
LETGAVRRYIKTSGDVLAESEVDIYPDAAGHIVRYLVEEGDTVRQNEVIATVDPSRPGENYSASPVTAAISGTVTSVPFVKGDLVTTQTPIAVISDLTNLKIETSVPERYVGKLHKGLGADIEFEAYPGEVFHAAVSALGSTLDTASRTLRVELELVQTDRRIKVGMFADIRIYIEQKTGVPVLPREALTGSTDQQFVFVADQDGTAERREIVLGLEGEEFLEVVSGVEKGEEVIVRGQSYLNDGDPIRIIE